MGALPSRVYRIVAPAVLVASVTATGPEIVPPSGEITGAETVGCTPPPPLEVS